MNFLRPKWAPRPIPRFSPALGNVWKANDFCGRDLTRRILKRNSISVCLLIYLFCVFPSLWSRGFFSSEYMHSQFDEAGKVSRKVLEEFVCLLKGYLCLNSGKVVGSNLTMHSSSFRWDESENGTKKMFALQSIISKIGWKKSWNWYVNLPLG